MLSWIYVVILLHDVFITLMFSFLEALPGQKMWGGCTWQLRSTSL